MLQPFHRGIYEYLWSEHKYVALGYSIKAFNNTASRLCTPRQCLTMLKKLQNYALAERPEHLSALLSAYMQIKPHLSRVEREEIIKTILASEDDGAEKIYAGAIRFAETTLYGCRLFFPGPDAIYKFWDVQHHPGLWLCLGTFQLHLTPAEVMVRALLAGHTEKKAWVEACAELKQGVSTTTFASWPESLTASLSANNMVAQAGKTMWLHPRADFAYAGMNIEQPVYDVQHLAGLTLEKFWDSAEPGNETLASQPDFQQFKQNFEKLTTELSVQGQVEEAFSFLAETFSDLDSVSGVGMETAYEQIDAEQSEHGDDETED